MTSSARPVVLRNGAEVEDPLRVVLGFLKAAGRFDVSDPARPASFGEPDLRLANRGGARISAAQIAAILQRRSPIERALRDIPPGASLSAEVNSVPWLPLRQLFEAFADIRGVGMSKMTKALYPKRPALIPMLDSMVQTYLRDDDPRSPGFPNSSPACATSSWSSSNPQPARDRRIADGGCVHRQRGSGHQGVGERDDRGQ
jgi:hypothetical protein